MSEFTSVGTTDDIPEGEGRSFEVGNRTIAVFNINGEFTAIDDFCPHMGASLSAGQVDSENCTVSCPWHGWRFNVKDGTWADNPRVKTDAFEVRVEGNRVMVLNHPTGNKAPGGWKAEQGRGGECCG